jgi:hypothetical protein
MIFFGFADFLKVDIVNIPLHGGTEEGGLLMTKCNTQILGDSWQR